MGSSLVEGKGLAAASGYMLMALSGCHREAGGSVGSDEELG